MKVNIWIKREEVGPQLLTLTHYYLCSPGKDYVQVTISTDEFVRLEDKHNNKDLGRSEQNYTYCNEWTKKKLI